MHGSGGYLEMSILQALLAHRAVGDVKDRRGSKYPTFQGQGDVCGPAEIVGVSGRACAGSFHAKSAKIFKSEALCKTVIHAFDARHFYKKLAS